MKKWYDVGSSDDDEDSDNGRASSQQVEPTATAIPWMVTQQPSLHTQVVASTVTAAAQTTTQKSLL